MASRPSMDSLRLTAAPRVPDHILTSRNLCLRPPSVTFTFSVRVASRRPQTLNNAGDPLHEMPMSESGAKEGLPHPRAALPLPFPSRQSSYFTPDQFSAGLSDQPIKGPVPLDASSDFSLLPIANEGHPVLTSHK
ncbi:uncharacterized protein BO80DRAFT_447887 [Aspergillus ibericus CBS 121593]|uniref:Uncharacterized protein n=1 Tax=Aspergillus ibericus CBS 121593 TaxID=1448316 RepID=A0A395GRP6_9EURO|nr:hypothetical protein BO80DRAFT_447887 [Aspergillus ibericus CBS 121593]RAK97894.1 hypothetical protein BO80DRAFT_447887 [Aspergillus ibericus CBS 121593]